jgi:putative hydrolase of the HAD superfamily
VLDADGVIQATSTSFRRNLAQLVPATDADRFLADVFAAEAGPLVGDGDFATNLAQVLTRWGVNAPVSETLAMWTMIEPLAGLSDLIGGLRARGFFCALGTNQQALRARHMRDALGYGRIFDACLFSCELRARKPDEAWFRAALTRLARPAAAVLFVDDHPDNVQAARSIGMSAIQFRMADHPDARDALSAALERAFGRDD